MNELEDFYETYVEKVYKFFYIQCLDVPTAEDLTSQTFIACIERFTEDTRDRKKYLYAVMRNVWADYLRKKYKESIQSVESIEDFGTYSEETVNAYVGMTIADRAKYYIDKLPEKQQLVARLRLIEERSVAEVAEELGKSSLYVKTTQHRAVVNLRKMLKEPELRSAL